MDSFEERRLSVNGKNAYISLKGDDFKQTNISDPNYNKNYLTAKTNQRARSCSPLLLSEKTKNNACVEYSTKENKQNIASPTTTIIPTQTKSSTTPTKMSTQSPLNAQFKRTTEVLNNGKQVNTEKTVSTNNGTSTGAIRKLFGPISMSILVNGI